VWIPGPLSEAFPYLYIIIGLVARLAIHHPLARFCTGLLVTAGIAIARARRASRHPIIGSKLEYTRRHGRTYWISPPRTTTFQPIRT
jgi:hypothetical protein